MDDGVGNKLREARTRRRLSLQQVEAATKIRGRYLQAIEDEDWDQLPEETYARAFIRTYATLVGLDGERLAEEQRRARGAARPGEGLPRVDPRARPVARARGGHRLLAIVVSLAIVAALVTIGLATGGGSEDSENGGAGPGQQRPAPHVGQAVPVR